MKIISTFLSIPKKGNKPSENEDSFYPRDTVVENDAASFAIADGASEGLLSAMWSGLLTISYVNFNEHRLNLDSFLKFSCEAFTTFEQKYIHYREKNDKPLQWYEENLLLNGSFSTLTGISFYKNANNEHAYTIHSIGDSIIFIIRKNELALAYPTQDVHFFGNRPDLISTNANSLHQVIEKIGVSNGMLEDGDIIYLMTDAIAHWFLQKYHSSVKPWAFFNLFNDFGSSEFREYILRMRDLKRIKNDDITIARLHIHCGEDA